MENKPHSTWPKYWQYSGVTAAPPCIASVVMMAVMVALRFRHIKMNWLQYLGIYFAGGMALCLLPRIVITVVNGCICLAWWFRIGRLTTWKSAETRIANEEHQYQIHVKRIYTGMASFGTYTTYKGGQE
jgi:hypothetical protein